MICPTFSPKPARTEVARRYTAWWGQGELASMASCQEGRAWELRLSLSHLLPCGNVVPILPDLQIFFSSQEKPEIWNFMRNLPIFKSWQLIQNIFKTLHGPKREGKKSLPTAWSGTLDCDLFPERRELGALCLASRSALTKLPPVL